MPLSSPTCVIPRGFHRYHVVLREVRAGYGPSKNYDRWRGANPSPLPHYEAEVWRGGLRAYHGDLCCGPGWDDTFGRTPAEAVSKARKLAREWVRWQLGLGRGA